jgi:hypothetical protein
MTNNSTRNLRNGEVACVGPQHHRKEISTDGVSLVWLFTAAVIYTYNMP